MYVSVYVLFNDRRTICEHVQKRLIVLQACNDALNNICNNTIPVKVTCDTDSVCARPLSGDYQRHLLEGLIYTIHITYVKH